MVRREAIIAIIIGFVLFISDFVFGWMTALSGPVPVIFIMAFIIGIIAGRIGSALLCTLAAWTLGILVGALITPIVFVDLIASEQSIFSLLLFVVLYSLRGLYSFTYEGNIVEVIVVGLLYIAVMIILTPLIYAISLVFSLLGGLFGKLLYESLKKKGQPEQSAPPVSGSLQ